MIFKQSNKKATPGGMEKWNVWLNKATKKQPGEKWNFRAKKQHDFQTKQQESNPGGKVEFSRQKTTWFSNKATRKQPRGKVDFLTNKATRKQPRGKVDFGTIRTAAALLGKKNGKGSASNLKNPKFLWARDAFQESIKFFSVLLFTFSYSL